MIRQNYNISLNLGGGAARGYAHIGVLKCFEEFRIPFDIIIGISMGAFVGSLYATVPDSEFVHARVDEWLNSEKVQSSAVVHFNKDQKETAKSVLKKLNSFYTKSGALGRILLGTALLNAEEVESAFAPFLPPIDITNTRLPFATTAVDLNKGISRVFTSGYLPKVVLASMALPMVFPPVSYEDNWYSDGGVLDKLGIDAATKLNITNTIVVDVSNQNISDENIRNGLDVMFRAEEIASIYRRKKQIEKATVLIKAIKGNIHWADYSASEEVIEMGYESAREQVDEIREKMRVVSHVKKFFSFFRKITSDKPSLV